MGLALLGIALGVAVVVAVDLANQSASRGFALSHEALTGRATHQILAGPGGLPERLYTRLRIEQGLSSAAPVVEGFVVHGGRTLRVLGVDPLAETGVRPALGGVRGPITLDRWLLQPGGVLLLAADAERLGVAAGQTLTVQAAGHERRLRILGLLEPARPVDREGLRDVLVMDIAAAQELLGKPGRLDRIDLVTTDAEALRAVRDMLPGDAQLVAARQQAAALEQMTAAFRLNLTAFSLLALVVGGFLIYNSMTFSVVQRRTLIGMLRAVGVTRPQVFRLLLAEALALGVAGTLAGVVLGVVLSQVLLELVTRTINDLYFVLTVREVELAPWSLAKGVALGVGASMLAALAPAYEATRAAPRVALSHVALEQQTRRGLPWLAVGAIALLLIGLGLLAWAAWLPANFAGLFAVIMAAALAAPLAALGLMRLLTPPLGAALGLLGRMAARSIGAALSRTAVAIAALMIAVSAVIGVGVMVDSFRHTFSLWLDSTLRADIYVSPAGATPSGLDPAVIDALTAVPGVDWHSSARHVNVGWNERPIRLRVFDIPRLGRQAFQFKEGKPDTAWPAFQDEDAVLVTEPFAAHNGVELGDSLMLATRLGQRPFRVVGVLYDYSSSEGAIMMSRGTYSRYWNDPVIDSIGIHAAAGVDVELLRQRLLEVAERMPQPLRIRSNRELREASLQVFDQTFTITHVLRLLAMLVAGVGVLSALLALALERAREFAVLRAIGFTPRQLWVLVTAQTGLVGLAAGVLAIPLGLALAAALVLVINQRSFGWSLLVYVDSGVLLQALLLAVAAALAAGLYPAWRLAAAPPAAALREE